MGPQLRRELNHWGNFGLTAKGAGQSPAKWYQISNVSLDAVDIYIYEEIGFWGVSAQDFVRDLLNLQTSKINLHLNSPGGEVFDGIAIHGALKSHPADVTVYVDALAASAASFIAMAGDTVKIMRNAQMMIHEGHGIVMGTKSDMRAMGDLLDKVDANIADMYLAKAGGTAKAWMAAMQEETWYSAAEAKAAGLADEVIDSWEMSPEGVAPGEDPEAYDPENAWSDRLTAKRLEREFRYTGRSKAPEPYVPSLQQNSTAVKTPLTIEPAPQAEPASKVDVAAVIRELRNLKEVGK